MIDRLRLFILFIILISVTVSCKAQDALQAAGKFYKVRLENEYVRVLETNANPGDTIPMHSHPSGFAYTVTPCTITFIFPDGKTKLVSAKAGEVLWHDPLTHSMVIHDNSIRIIHTELKCAGTDTSSQGIKK